MCNAIFDTHLSINNLVLARQFTAFQVYFNLHEYFGCWNFDIFKMNYHRKKRTPFYQVNTPMSRLQIIPNRCFHELLSHLAPIQVRGFHLFKTQQKHMTSCAIHPDTTVMNTEAILSTPAKLHFFPAEAPKREYSFFLFCIDTAVPKADAETCYAQIWFTVLCTFLCFQRKEDSQGTCSSASLWSTFSPEVLHDISQHPI